MEKEKILLYAESKDKSVGDLVGELHYSERHLRRLNKKHFGRSWKALRQYMIMASIISDYLYNDCTNKQLVIKYDYTESALCKAVKNFFGKSLQTIKKEYKEGGREMTEAEKHILKAKVIAKLSNAKGNLTLSQLEVPRCIIVELRRDGFEIVSVPGRYNGGYNLARTSKTYCVNWINNVRVSRFGLPADFAL